MNGCEPWEELLLQFQDLEPGLRQRVEFHLAACAGCREFLETLEAVDMELTAALNDVETAPGFDIRVRARAGSLAPSPRPELIEALDGIGWLSIAGILAILAAHWVPEWAARQLSTTWLNPSLLPPMGAVLIAGAVVYGWRTWKELAE